MGKIRSCITGFFIALASCLVALGLVEVCVRYFFLGRAPAAGWTDRPPYYFRAEASKTLQDYAHETQKPEGVFRIAVIGDSYAFAPYMQFTDAFPKKLEQMLNLNAGVPKVEVINYGVPAYSTSHEIATTEQAIAEGADLVILQITLNDPELKPYRPTGINLTLTDKFGGIKFEGFMTSLVSYWKTLGFVLERLHNANTHREYGQYFIDLFENPRTWNPFRDSMKKLHEKCKAAGVPSVAVVFPLFGTPLDGSYQFTAIHQKLGGLLQELAVPTLDLFELYKGIPIDRLQVIPGADRHPNEIAHRMAAEKIYGWLEERNLIPDAVKIRQKFDDRTDIYGRQQ